MGLQQALPVVEIPTENEHKKENAVPGQEFDFNLHTSITGKLFDIILSPTYSSDYLPYELRTTKKKKKKRGLGL